MKRWHLFNDGIGTPTFGFGTVEQARRHLASLHRRRVTNHHAMTTFEEGEEPPEAAVVVDLDTGDILPDRHERKPFQG